MHCSILLVTIPPGQPWDKSSPSGLGVGNCLKQSCPMVGGGANQNILRSTCHFFALLVRWLQTAGLRMFKGKHRNLSESG